MVKAIHKLIAKYNTPFYIFDEKGFIDNYKTLESIFHSVYPNYRISYSYKTNYTPFVCNIVKQLGGYAEVVSDMEYELAKLLGYRNDMIVYNGPSKGSKIFEHLDNGGILNIDSLDEALIVTDHCIKNPHKEYTCGIRINLNLSDTFVSRFGLQDGSEDFEATIKLIRETPNLRLVGLHCHISRCRSKESWAERAKVMIKTADKYIDGIPQYISLGSGMYADMPEFLKNQFGGDVVPTYIDYAKAAIRPFTEHYGKGENTPLLFTEPGTTLIARYISFVTRVLSIKKIQDRAIANMDGSFHNLGEICTMKKLPVTIIDGGNKRKVYDNLDIMGYTCLEQDLMFHQFKSPLAVNDILIFENVGGYSIVEKPQFIKPQCPMYVKHSDGSVKEIMRAECFNDIFDKFIFE